MTTYFMYDNNGNYVGCTTAPNEHPEFNSTPIEPPVYDEFTEKLVFVSGAWQVQPL